jgi:hypothetical protein
MVFEATKIHDFCTLFLLLVISFTFSAETMPGSLKEGATNTHEPLDRPPERPLAR